MEVRPSKFALLSILQDLRKTRTATECETCPLIRCPCRPSYCDYGLCAGVETVTKTYIEWAKYELGPPSEKGSA